MGEEEEWVARDAEMQGHPIPDRIANKPTLLPGLEIYHKAFHRLSTCRSMGFGMGPVPWTAIEAYSTAMGFDDRHRHDLHYHMRAMDSTFLNHSNKRKDKEKPPENNG